MQITFSISGATEVQKMLSGFAEKAPDAIAETLHYGAEKIRLDVSRAYRGRAEGVGALEDVKDTTALRRLAGKYKKKWDRVVPYKSSAPLNRSGTLANNIVAVRQGRSKKNPRFVIKPNGRVFEPYAGWGKKRQSITKIADKMEHGYHGTVEKTLRSVAYLKAVFSGKARSRRATRRDTSYLDKKVGYISYFVPPRPVWGPVRRHWQKKGLDYLIPILMKKLGIK